jgi:hypothetical protein
MRGVVVGARRVEEADDGGDNGAVRGRRLLFKEQ